MEAALLMFDVIGMVIVLLWAARGRGNAGLLGWRPDGHPDRRSERPRAARQG